MILEVEDDIEIIGEASDGAQASRGARASCPDVVSWTSACRMDGIEATRDPGRRRRAARLMLTTFDLNEYVYEALRAAAAVPAQGRPPSSSSRGHPRRRRRDALGRDHSG
jgi:DNA-binding NarL/FixJ family response regulator